MSDRDGAPDPLADLASTLGKAGIARPPFGSTPETAVRAYGKWSWGSLSTPPYEMYMFDVGLIAAMLCAHGPFVALSHAGHGVNSYALSLVTAAGPIAAFVQHPYGGAYSDPLKDLISINATYSRLHVFFHGGARQVDQPLRWLLAFSALRGTSGIVDLDRVRDGSPAEKAFERIEPESELFTATAERSGWGQDFIDGRVSW
jgi:hypothetical protein